MWADNADYCAKQYTGTGALKTDYTRYSCIDNTSMVCLFYIGVRYRTGKRTLLGALKDGFNSAIRYYYNNFQDGYRQVSTLTLINA